MGSSGHSWSDGEPWRVAFSRQGNVRYIIILPIYNPIPVLLGNWKIIGGHFGI
jgi:hypothetical protein